MSIFSLNVSKENKDAMFNAQNVTNTEGSSKAADQKNHIKTLDVQLPNSGDHVDSNALSNALSNGGKEDLTIKVPIFSADSLGSSVGSNGEHHPDSKMSATSPLKLVMVPQYEPGSKFQHRLGTTQPKASRPVNINKPSHEPSPHQSSTFLSNRSSQIRDVKRILDSYEVEQEKLQTS
jgi:hypothetical protein